MQHSLLIKSLKFIIIDVVLDFVYFPLWWYSQGLKQVGSFVGRQIKQEALNLSLALWLKNMFTPMYSDYTLSGRLVSFFMRAIVLIYRLVVLSLWSVLLIGLLLVWLVLPILVAWQIVRLLS